MLSAFMMLALTVSGTGSSCILLFVLFAGFTRAVCAIFMGCLESIDLLAANDMWSCSFFSPLWFLPINVISYVVGNFTDSAALMYTLPNILYSAAVTLGVFSLAGFIYTRRRSEMAGNPAPGVRTQALFRILFTILPALLIPLLAVTDSADASITLVLVVAVLLVYFLYELVTTKRPKNLLKIIPGLGIVATACIVFTVLFFGYRSLVLYEDVTKDEVKTVSVESAGFQTYSYQGRMMETLRTDDPEIVKTIVKQLALSQKYEREGNWERKGLPDGVNYWSRMTVTLHLKGGRSLRRSIVIDEKAQREIGERYGELDEVRELLYCLPSDSEISGGGVELGRPEVYREYIPLDPADLAAVMTVFRHEFATLSEAQILEVMSPSLVYDTRENYDERDVLLNLIGRTQNGSRYHSDYYISDAMPETRAYLIALMGVSQQEANYLDTAGQTYGGSVDSTLAALGQCAEDPAFAETFGYLKGSVTLLSFDPDGKGKDYNTAFYLESADYARLVELLLEASVVHGNTQVDAVSPTEHTHYLILRTDMESKYANVYLSLRGLFELPPDAYGELVDLLHMDE
jgi:heme/copper-type cytochrome/quinol oxidase subunit 2